MSTIIKFGTSGWRAIIARNLRFQDKIDIGGAESAGLSICHHVPEKDGVLDVLLCCEAVGGAAKKSIGEQMKDLFSKVGSFMPLERTSA